MTTSNKKQKILTVLSQQQQPISLPTLLETLGAEFAERSVRRWLNELVSKGLVAKTGAKRGTLYQAVEHSDGLFTNASKDSIAYIRQPIFNRDPVAYHKNWLTDYQPNKTSYLSQQKCNLLFEHGQRQTNHDPAGTYARKIYNRLLIDLSYNSSRLEGNTYSLIDTEKLIIDGIEQQNKLSEEKVMILNHKEAIRHLVDTAHKLKIEANEICTLHYLLSDGLVPTHLSGKLRDHGVRIGASTYVPLENPATLEKQLDIICDKAQSIIDPYEQSFFLLVHLAYLQAFTDVNKRTSRLSANISLIKTNLVPLSFNDINKDDYSVAMLAIYELNDPKPLIDLYCYSYLRTCQLYNATVESLAFDEVRVRFRRQRRDLVEKIIDNEVIGKKMNAYIDEQIKQLATVPKKFIAEFKEDVLDDLKALNPSRIIGMGITPSQLKKWLELNKTSNS